MTDYLLSMYYGQSTSDVPDDLPEIMARVEALNEKIRADGAWVWAGGLEPTPRAQVVHAKRDGETIVTDGPYLETHEGMGGFWIISADSPDAARMWAAEASIALGIPVEVRAFAA
jgi:hypothetical protein